MKKALSLLMAFLMLFSSLCVGANAVKEQAADETQANEERISFTGDKLKEKFGIEQILLPEGYEPVGYVHYDGSYYFEKPPEYITVVLNDGTTVEVKTGAETYAGNLKIKAYCHYDIDGRFNLRIHITEDANDNRFDFSLDYCKWKSLPFSEDFDRYKQNISKYYIGFMHGYNPKDFDLVMDSVYTGNSAIDSALNTIRGQLIRYPLPVFLIDVVIETAQFLSYRFKEAISFS